MPLNVRRFYTFFFLILVGSVSAASGQTVTSTPAFTAPALTSGDVMRDRISKAKAFVAVRNYNAAIYELENIRRETSDTAVQAVVNVLLMTSYLEQGDYKRSQELLNEFYTAQKANKPNASTSYLAVAAQIVKGARSRVERYRALGLSVSDRLLPLEALNDLEKMRETLEVVITQSKQLGTEKVKAAEAMALLEEASNSRGMLARDDYDARRWKDEVADTREQITSSRSVVVSAVNGDTTPAVNSDAGAPVEQRPINTAAVIPQAPPAGTGAKTEPPVYIPASPQPVVKEEPKPNVAAQNTPTQPVPNTAATTGNGTAELSPLEVGSLVGYATKQTPPIYPSAAKTIRASGVVRVDVLINEAGDVATVKGAVGPSLLQAAAKDAIKKWKFRPFMRDGQPVKANGFVSFNFAL